MTIELTTNRELISVLGNNFVRNFILYNDQNQNKLDTIFGLVGPHEYTPVISSVNSPVPNLGADGFSEGIWYKFLDTVFAWGRFGFAGSGLDPGSSGNNWFTASLPLALAENLPSGSTSGLGALLGIATYKDSGTPTNRQMGTVSAASATEMWFQTEKDGNDRTVEGTAPFVWADGDIISWHIKYRGVS